MDCSKTQSNVLVSGVNTDSAILIMVFLANMWDESLMKYCSQDHATPLAKPTAYLVAAQVNEMYIMKDAKYIGLTITPLIN